MQLCGVAASKNNRTVCPFLVCFLDAPESRGSRGHVLPYFSVTFGGSKNSHKSILHFLKASEAAQECGMLLHGLHILFTLVTWEGLLLHSLWSLWKLYNKLLNFLDVAESAWEQCPLAWLPEGLKAVQKYTTFSSVFRYVTKNGVACHLWHKCHRFAISALVSSIFLHFINLGISCRLH